MQPHLIRDRQENGKWMPKIEREYDHSRDDELRTEWLKKNKPTIKEVKEPIYKEYTGKLTNVRKDTYFNSKVPKWSAKVVDETLLNYG